MHVLQRQAQHIRWVKGDLQGHERSRMRNGKSLRPRVPGCALAATAANLLIPAELQNCLGQHAQEFFHFDSAILAD